VHTPREANPDRSFSRQPTRACLQLRRMAAQAS
jgi:hypothetical protein